jgi:hypothetical protein
MKSASQQAHRLTPVFPYKFDHLSKNAQIPADLQRPSRVDPESRRGMTDVASPHPDAGRINSRHAISIGRGQSQTAT